MDRVKLENRFVEIRAGGVTLPGTLSLPPGATGIVIFLHAFGSGRLSPQSQYIGRYLEKAGLGTLAFDLLTLSEVQIDQETGALRSDIDLLSGRTQDTIRWLMLQDYSDGLHLGLFGDGTGAAAAIATAVQSNDLVRAVVTLDGQLSLSNNFLPRIAVPILAIVRKQDDDLMQMTEAALEKIPAKVQKNLEAIIGKDPRWQEPGMMDQVVRLTVDWFRNYLITPFISPFP
jgi:dienelactone hydrolase